MLEIFNLLYERNRDFQYYNGLSTAKININDVGEFIYGGGGAYVFKNKNGARISGNFAMALEGLLAALADD